MSSGKTKVLIDCGLSGKRIRLALEAMNIDISEIDAILVTHEHGDHIRGLKVLAFRYGIPVLANSETAKAVVEILGDCPKFKIFGTGESFEFGELEIHPFSVPHDTVDPVMYTVKTGSLKLGFCTDLGYVTTLVRQQLRYCDYLYVEANHDPDMVRNCARPPVYKQRVLGRAGHLSNQACAELLAEVYHPGLKHVTLAHLSSECNTDELAHSTVSNHLLQQGIRVPVHVAPKEEIGEAVHFDAPQAVLVG